MNEADIELGRVDKPFTHQEWVRLKDICNAATPASWCAVLGSGENQCTAIMTDEDGRKTFIADCLPEYSLALKLPESHVPNLNFIIEAREAMPKLLEEIANLKRRLNVALAGKVICEHCFIGEAYEDAVIDEANVGGTETTGNPICDGCAEACEDAVSGN